MFFLICVWGGVGEKCWGVFRFVWVWRCAFCWDCSSSFWPGYSLDMVHFQASIYWKKRRKTVVLQGG